MTRLLQPHILMSEEDVVFYLGDGIRGGGGHNERKGRCDVNTGTDRFRIVYVDEDAYPIGTIFCKGHISGNEFYEKGLEVLKGFALKTFETFYKTIVACTIQGFFRYEFPANESGQPMLVDKDGPGRGVFKVTFLDFMNIIEQGWKADDLQLLGHELDRMLNT